MTEHNHNFSAEKPLNPPDVPMEDKQRQLEGRQPEDQQSGAFDSSEVDKLEGMSPTDQYEGELEAGAEAPIADDAESLDTLVERETRSGETTDPFKAAEEGQTYIPAIDPPTIPSNDYEAARIASGIGASVFSESYDAEHHVSALPDEDEMSERIYEALRADSSTSPYAERVSVNTRGRTVVLRGMVDDLEDSNNLIAVAKYVNGVEEVIDKTHVRGLEQRSA